MKGSRNTMKSRNDTTEPDDGLVNRTVIMNMNDMQDKENTKSVRYVIPNSVLGSNPPKYRSRERIKLLILKT